MAVSSVYNNFGSKAGLYAAVVDRALDDQLHALLDLAADVVTRGLLRE